MADAFGQRGGEQGDAASSTREALAHDPEATTGVTFPTKGSADVRI
ncbi:hypothetical protein [Phenylobacterium sp.]